MSTSDIATTSRGNGHLSELLVADLLEKHVLSGTFHVPCFSAAGKPLMQAADIAHLRQWFEIGGRTGDHISRTGSPPQLAENGIRINEHWLEEFLGRDVPGFAYVRGALTGGCS